MIDGATISKPSQVIIDRASAIEYAVSLATTGDTVIILGKGHEVGQEINGEVFDFDDRLILAQKIEAKR
jgi:UDP-N-acetylmuramoyl-L-alanyl-D-glutamate--2,6-diaminopimelate ligase